MCPLEREFMYEYESVRYFTLSLLKALKTPFKFLRISDKESLFYVGQISIKVSPNEETVCNQYWNNIWQAIPTFVFYKFTIQSRYRLKASKFLNVSYRIGMPHNRIGMLNRAKYSNIMHLYRLLVRCVMSQAPVYYAAASRMINPQFYSQMNVFNARCCCLIDTFVPGSGRELSSSLQN